MNSDIEEDESYETTPLSDPTPESRPLADDDDAMMSRLLKPVADYPVVDQKSSRWTIDDWSELRQDKVRGPRFSCGGIEWNVLLFPRGTSNSGFILIYLEPVPPENAPDNWYVCAQFGLALVNKTHPNVYLANPSHHRFTKSETDWGFSSLIDLRGLSTPQARFGLETIPVLQTGLEVIVYVRILDDLATGVLWHKLEDDYDSKQATGYVGLNNQGATCYLNSLLQSYFATANFRKLVYQIPGDESGTAVPGALQRMFYMMLTSQSPVSTMELTRSFGWDTLDAFMQHDIQELNRVLMDKLETAMKGTTIEGELNLVFVGKMKLYIKCINVDYESLRIEEFWDIQLNVQGFANLEQLFQNYIEIEMLDGENKYQANDEYGYQDAKKGVVFELFPLVLHLQLKRFKYDFILDEQVKIDDFYEFPDEIDLSPYLDDDLPHKKENNTYKLHGVLVHQGLISNGHYYAMIRPDADGGWLKFDDDKVTKVTPYQVFNENFGADEPSPVELQRMTRAEQQESFIRRVTLAYMLVYYREGELDAILERNVDIPQAIPQQIERDISMKQQAEQLRQEEMYYLPVKYILTTQAAAHVGFDLAVDDNSQKLFDERLVGTLADPPVVKVRKDAPFSQFVAQVAEAMGYLPDSDQFQLLPVAHRCNQTNRVDRPLASDATLWTVAQVYAQAFIKKYDNMAFFVEEANKELTFVTKNARKPCQTPESFDWTIPTTTVANAGGEASLADTLELGSHRFVFVKYFDPVSQQLRGLTHATVLRDVTVASLFPAINRLLGFDENTPLAAYEELSPLKIERLSPELTLEKAELDNGDIITVEPVSAHTIASANGGRFSSARDYYGFMLTRMHIVVTSFKGVDGDEGSGDDESAIDLWVLTNDDYATVARVIADSIGNVDPEYLRLYVRLSANQGGQVFNLKSLYVLSQVFNRQMPVNQIVQFEYEVLPIKFVEYENLRHLKVQWVTNLSHSQPLEVMALMQLTIGEIVSQQILPQIEGEVNVGELLVWVGRDHRFYDFLKPDDSVEVVQEASDVVYLGMFPVEVYCLVANDMYTRFGPESEVKGVCGDGDAEAVAEEMVVAKRHINHINILPLFHFYKNLAYSHGTPFIFPLYPGEVFEHTKLRLQARLGMASTAFSKVRVALVDGTKGVYLDNDESAVYEELRKLRDYQHTLIALDHPDRLPRKSTAIDRGIFIK